MLCCLSKLTAACWSYNLQVHCTWLRAQHTEQVIDEAGDWLKMILQYAWRAMWCIWLFALPEKEFSWFKVMLHQLSHILSADSFEPVSCISMLAHVSRSGQHCSNTVWWWLCCHVDLWSQPAGLAETAVVCEIICRRWKCCSRHFIFTLKL